MSSANLSESTLNTANVTASTFGLLFKLAVDDVIYAQPLYVPTVSIPNKGTHNVVYVATMSDTLYAFNADKGGKGRYDTSAGEPLQDARKNDASILRRKWKICDSHHTRQA